MLLLGQHSQINGMCRSVISAFPSLLYLLYIVTYEVIFKTSTIGQKKIKLD